MSISAGFKDGRPMNMKKYEIVQRQIIIALNIGERFREFWFSSTGLCHNRPNLVPD